MSQALGTDPLRQSLFKKTGPGAEGGAATPPPPPPGAPPAAGPAPDVPEPGPSASAEIAPPAPIATTEDLPDELDVVCFRLGRREFGLDISSVQRIIPMVEITEVPQPLPFLEGVIDLLGAIVPVISLRRLLGMPRAEVSLRHHIIIGDRDGDSVGLIVDSVSDLITIPKPAIDPPTSVTPLREFLTGVARLQTRIVFLFRLERIIDLEKEAESRSGLDLLLSGASTEHDFEETTESQEADPIRQILRRRAEALSHKVQREEARTRQLLTFSLGEEWYGVDTAKVRTIVASPVVVPVPCAPAYVRGIMNLRGEILTVIGLKRFFGLEEQQTVKNPRALVVEDDGLQAAFIVDSVYDVIELPETSIERPLSTIEKIRADYIEGEARIGDRLLGILKLQTTMNPEQATS